MKWYENKDWYLKAVELAKEYGFINNKDAVESLAFDIREINNHFIFAGQAYIEYALENKLYITDPFCENRPSLNEIEELEYKLGIEEHYLLNPNKLFRKSYINNPKKALEERAIILN